MNKGIAEIIGLFIGDGCLSRYFSKYENRWKSIVLFTGNLYNDKKYYENILQPLILKNFGVRGYIYHRNDDNTLRYFIDSKKLINYLLKMGFKFGSKTNSCKIPITILGNKELEIACICGIFNADGTVYRRYSKKYKGHSKFYKKYAVVQIKMKNKVLIRQIRNILQKTGFKLNKVTKDKGCWLIRITNQKYVEKFFKEIATTHPYHLTRYKNIKTT